MKSNLFIFFLFLFSVEAFSQLTCSRNGTEIIYINGVLVPKDKGASDVKDEITKIVIGESNRFDLTNIYASSTAYKPVSKLSTTYVYNQSTYLGDFIELVTGKLREKGDPNPYQSWSAAYFLGGNMVMSAQSLAARGLKNFFTNISTVTTDKELKQRRLNAANEINIQRYTMEQLIDIDETVVNRLQNKIISSLNDNKKVIVVSHSQGNVVANDAINRLPASIDGVPKDTYLANLQIASPAAGIVAQKGRLIKLHQDRVVSRGFGTGFGLGMASNYDLINDYDAEFTRHLMVETYLNNQLIVPGETLSDPPQSMQKLFKDKVEELATMFPDNCPAPVAEIRFSDVPNKASIGAKVTASLDVDEENGGKIISSTWSGQYYNMEGSGIPQYITKTTDGETASFSADFAGTKNVSASIMNEFGKKKGLSSYYTVLNNPPSGGLITYYCPYLVQGTVGQGEDGFVTKMTIVDDSLNGGVRGEIDGRWITVKGDVQSQVLLRIFYLGTHQFNFTVTDDDGGSSECSLITDCGASFEYLLAPRLKEASFKCSQ